MTEVELIIKPDGSIMVCRGSVKQNEITSDLLRDSISDKDALSNFLAVSDDCEVLFGEQSLCG